MDKNKGIAIAVAVLLGIGLLAYLGRPRTSDEQQIRNLIEKIRLAVTEKSPSGVLEQLAADYKDSRGLDRQELRRMLLGHFLQSKKPLSCVAIVDEVEIAEDKKNATAVVWAAAFEGGSLGEFELPERAEAFRFEVQLRPSDEGWKITRSTQQRVSPDEMMSLMSGV